MGAAARARSDDRRSREQAGALEAAADERDGGGWAIRERTRERRDDFGTWPYGHVPRDLSARRLW